MRLLGKKINLWFVWVPIANALLLLLTFCLLTVCFHPQPVHLSWVPSNAVAIEWMVSLCASFGAASWAFCDSVSLTISEAIFSLSSPDSPLLSWSVVPPLSLLSSLPAPSSLSCCSVSLAMASLWHLWQGYQSFSAQHLKWIRHVSLP